VKIIKPGREVKQGHWVYRGTCWRCGCVIEISEDEEMELYNDGRFMDCPTKDCGMKIDPKRVYISIEEDSCTPLP
jgi:hypothetical protein